MVVAIQNYIDFTCIFLKVYVMSKLTLHVDDDLIAAAKDVAASRNTSVSRLVSSYFRVLSKPMSDKTAPDLPPITASLLGCIQGADDSEESYLAYTEKKHS
jgi:hypothetical protein